MDAEHKGERFTRGELGLGPLGSRDDAFALCNFNQLYKLDPETFSVWANALRRLPNAFLWLSRVSVRKDTSLYAQVHTSPFRHLPRPSVTFHDLP